MEIMEAKRLTHLCVETNVEKEKIETYLKVVNNKENIIDDEYLQDNFYGYSVKDLESEFKDYTIEELQQRLINVTKKIEVLNEMRKEAIDKLTETELGILDMMISEVIESKQTVLNSVLRRANAAVREYENVSENKKTEAKDKCRIILSGCTDSIKSLKIMIHFYKQYIPSQEYNKRKKK